MIRGWLGGMVSGAAVSVVGLGAASVVLDRPLSDDVAAAPQLEAPAEADVVAGPVEEPAAVSDAPEVTQALGSPVGVVDVLVPDIPEVPDVSSTLTALPVEAPEADVEASVVLEVSPAAPQPETAPLPAPDVAVLDGGMAAPEAPEAGALSAQPLDPVQPNPVSQAPQTPVTEADLTLSTTPDVPVLVEDPQADVDVVLESDAPQSLVPVAEPASPAQETNLVAVVDDAPSGGDDMATEMVDDIAVVVPEAPEGSPAQAPAEDDEFFVVDLGTAPETPQPSDNVLAQADTTSPRLQLQGTGTLLATERDTGVVIRRPDASADQENAEVAAAELSGSDTSAMADDGPALTVFAADIGDVSGRPMMSVVLIDDPEAPVDQTGVAALSFPATIALDPSTANVSDRMASYRDLGFEVVVLAQLPDGAQPQDVEVTFAAVFQTLPAGVAVIDMGNGGLQSDRDVTEQAMSILAADGRGFLTASKGLNMAGRAADQAGVPSAVIYRDLDQDGQDARVIGRFVDQAAFRARQESGVVLVGRIRDETLTALNDWAGSNGADQVALVPVSAVLLNP